MKKRSIAGFDEVAEEQNINSNNDIDNNNDIKEDSIKNLLNLDKKKKVFVGIYFDPEIADWLDKLHSQEGKGAKSKIVNEAVKRLLKQEGIL